MKVRAVVVVSAVLTVGAATAAAVAQDLDVLERVGVLLTRLERRAELVDHLHGRLLEIGELCPPVGEQVLECRPGRGGRVLDDRARPADRQAFPDQAGQDVVDALPRHAGETCDLRRGGRATPGEREIGLGLVAGETESGQLRDHGPVRVINHLAWCQLG